MATQKVFYVHAVRDWYRVRAATTANGTLATAFANTSVVDGVTLATGDKILLKNQTTATENGVYIVAASGAPARDTNYLAPTVTDSAGCVVSVLSGTANAKTAWLQYNEPGVPGTDGLLYISHPMG